MAEEKKAKDTIDLTVITPPPLTVSCVPPLLWTCDERGSCTCKPVREACTVTIAYLSDQPGNPAVIVPAMPGCDSAGVELAIAVALSRLLGSQK